MTNQATPTTVTNTVTSNTPVSTKGVSLTSLATTSSLLTSTNLASSGNSTFVGNTPSAVLFFLAMAVGVAIACLFIFFTIRYFVRSRYGFHMYTVSSRGVLFSSSVSSELTHYQYSNREIREHLQYLRTHHFIRDEFLERRLSNIGRRRRRRGRFSRMKKLTPQEVEELFPKLKYSDWINSGTEVEAVSQLAELASSIDTTKPNVSVLVDGSDVVELQDLDLSHPDAEDDENDHVIAYIGPDGAAVRQENKPTSDSHSDAVSLGQDIHTMHFDSGSCAICLDAFEVDDIVRGLICGHVYHSDCLDPWLTRRRACCPICKRDYYKEDNATTRVNPVSTSNIVEGEFAHDNQSTAASNGDSETHNDAPQTDTGTNNEATSTFDILTDDINHEYLRRDSHIQALFSELIPLSERVRVILDEHPNMDLESRGREIAAHKYRSVLRKIFWRLMGISKEDLYYWAVLDLYQNNPGPDTNDNNNTSETVQTPSNDVPNDTQEPGPATNYGTDVAMGTSMPRSHNDVSERQERDLTELNREVLTDQDVVSTPYGNSETNTSEIEISDARRDARREAVERNA